MTTERQGRGEGASIAAPVCPNPGAVTTRGMGEAEMRTIAKWIAEALEHRTDAARLATIRGQVGELAERFPLYGFLRA